MQELYEKRKENIIKTANRQPHEWVPVVGNPSNGVLGYAGVTVYDVIHDEELMLDSMTRFLKILPCDSVFDNMLSVSPYAYEALGNTQERLGPDGITQEHIQKPMLKPEDYPAFLEDPERFVKEVLVPRKYPYLFTGDMEEAKARLRTYLSESYGSMESCMKIFGKMQEDYGVVTIEDMMSVYPGVPAADTLFDYFRGFKGTLTDLRRHRDMVSKAIDVIWDWKMQACFETEIEVSFPYAALPAHIPAYMSPRDFKELYWPHLLKILEKLDSVGNKLSIILEGRWLHLLPVLRDAPKDSMILKVDDDDIFEVHRILGDCQIIAGGCRMADLKMMKKQQCIDYTKRVFDELAPSNAFMFTTDKNWICPGDFCPNLIEVYEFAAEYGKY